MILFPTVDEDYQYFVSQGYSGSINDMHYQALGVLGYTGSYTDRLYAYLVETYGSYHQALYDLRSGVSTFALLSYAIGGFEPQLVFDFTTDFYRTGGSTSTFDNSLTYTGASSKTMVDSDGLLKWAPHNLVKYSEQFDNAAWSKRGTTITANAVASPDGGLTADKLVESATTANHNVGYNTGGVLTGIPGSFSVFAKAAERDILYVGDEPAKAAWFNLGTGTVGTEDAGVTGSILDVGGGWYLCTIYVPSPTSGVDNWQIGVTTTDNVHNYTGDGTSGIYIWGAHLYRSDLGGMVDNPDRSDSYVPTTSAAVYLPRRGHHIYNGSTWVNEGLLLESEARTNLVTYSEAFSDASWTKDGATIDPDAATGPDGLTSADRLNVTAGAGDHQVFDPVSGYTTGDTVCNSVFAKVDGGRYLAVTIWWSANNYVSQVFDLSDGSKGDTNLGPTSGALVGSGTENYGNGWWRLHVAGTSAATTGNVVIAADAADSLSPTIESATGAPTFTAVAGEDYFIYGAQIEIGRTPSSYIPTAGATVTRAAETLTVAAANLPYSAVAMSMQASGKANYTDNGSATEILIATLGSTSNYHRLGISTATSRTGWAIYKIRDTSPLESADDESNTDVVTPGINRALNIASRWVSGDVLNVAFDGTSYVGNTNLTDGPDLTGLDSKVGQNYMGTIGKFRMWDDDLGDTGIATASARTYTTEFAMIVATTTPSETFTIPCQNVGAFNAGIDWGDGQVSTVTAYNDAALTHTYAAAGDHVIRITGTFPNIYFNNGGDKLKVKSVENFGEVGWTRADEAFYGCSNMTSFTSGTTDTSALLYMNNMFRDCTSLASLDVTNFDTSSVTNMFTAFYQCSSLTTLDVSGFNTAAVTNMSNMFYDCNSLTTLDVSSFNTAAVTDMSNMFRSCTSLTTLDVSSFNTAAVTNMSNMFRSCTSLTTLDVSSFNTAAVTKMNSMFRSCTSLTTLDVSSFNTAAVTDMNYMFYGCSSVTTLDVSSFNTAVVTDMSTMFRECTSLTDIVGVDTFDIGGLNTTTSLTNFATNVTLPTARYDALLIAWEAQDPFDGMSPNFGSSTYTGGGAVATAHASLISRDGWTITDGGVA